MRPGEWLEVVAEPEDPTGRADHELNPHYEMHVGRPLRAGDGESYRHVSLWLEGRRWSGVLWPGDA